MNIKTLMVVLIAIVLSLMISVSAKSPPLVFDNTSVGILTAPSDTSITIDLYTGNVAVQDRATSEVKNIFTQHLGSAPSIMPAAITETSRPWRLKQSYQTNRDTEADDPYEQYAAAVLPYQANGVTPAVVLLC